MTKMCGRINDDSRYILFRMTKGLVVLMRVLFRFSLERQRGGGHITDDPRYIIFRMTNGSGHTKGDSRLILFGVIDFL